MHAGGATGPPADRLTWVVRAVVSAIVLVAALRALSDAVTFFTLTTAFEGEDVTMATFLADEIGVERSSFRAVGVTTIVGDLLQAVAIAVALCVLDGIRTRDRRPPTPPR